MNTTSVQDDGVVLIHRNNPADHFVIVPNATARDERLSYAARGALTEMLSRPTGWRISADQMARANKAARDTREGRETMRGIFRELRGAGYLHRIVTRQADGHFSTALHCYSEPAHCDEPGCQDCPRDDNRRTVNPSSVPPAETRVFPGRTDDGFTDVRSTRRHKEDRPTEDRENTLPARTGASVLASADPRVREYLIQTLIGNPDINSPSAVMGAWTAGQAEIELAKAAANMTRGTDPSTAWMPMSTTDLRVAQWQALKDELRRERATIPGEVIS